VGFCRLCQLGVFERLAVTRAFPLAVLAPELKPPWFLHRFLPSTGKRLQGWPALVWDLMGRRKALLVKPAKLK